MATEPVRSNANGGGKCQRMLHRSLRQVCGQNPEDLILVKFDNILVDIDVNLVSLHDSKSCPLHPLTRFAMHRNDARTATHRHGYRASWLPLGGRAGEGLGVAEQRLARIDHMSPQVIALGPVA
jgi:hypothetical protein